VSGGELPFTGVVSVGTTLADGVAASDWASAAEKSSVAVAAVVVFVEEVDVAAEARAVRRPPGEWSAGLSDWAARCLAGDLELDESELLPAPGRSVLEDPREEGCGVFGADGFPPVGALLLPPMPEAAGGELAGVGFAETADAADAADAGGGAAVGPGNGLNVSMESAAMGECPMGPELL